jgi:thiamine pyrophosphokinase
VPTSPERPTTVVVVAGGEPIDPRLRAVVPDGAPVLAADSGADHALALGLEVDELIGDLDSVREASIDAVATAGGTVDRHPAAKDHTDLELALLRATERRPDRILVLGGHGERDDHHLANRLLLAAPFLATSEVIAWSGRARIAVIRTSASFTGPAGSLLSLLAVGGPARGITTSGLRYPLRGETLEPGSTRGISNELVATEAAVTLDDGVLLAVQPHALDQLEDRS